MRFSNSASFSSIENGFCIAKSTISEKGEELKYLLYIVEQYIENALKEVELKNASKSKTGGDKKPEGETETKTDEKNKSKEPESKSKNVKKPGVETEKKDNRKDESDGKTTSSPESSTEPATESATDTTTEAVTTTAP